MITSKMLLVYLLQSASISGTPVDTSSINMDEAYCLAKNVYYEARSEDIQGQFAVASVTLNRVNDPRFPKTVCGVVKEHFISKVTHQAVCAFSWFCQDKLVDKEILLSDRRGVIDQHRVDQFQVAAMVAILALTGNTVDNTHGSTNFYNPSIAHPAWSRIYAKMARIGNHVFCKMPQLEE